MKVLLVEDDPVTQRLLAGILEQRGHSVTVCQSAEDAQIWQERENFPLIVLDWVLPGMDGLEFCRQVRARPEGDACVILVATVRQGEAALQEVLEAGADDYLTKPLDPGHLHIRLRIAEQRVADLRKRKEAENEVHALRNQLESKGRFHRLIGKSAAMADVYGLVDQLAAVGTTVLIEGETGTGKELVARAVHNASPRQDRPFIAVNCAGLTESLIASQLFGHRRGAFTGALADHQGYLEAAEGGTLFLDEIGDIPTGIQASLLRFLQEREIYRLGDSKPRQVDVRILTATHRDLPNEVEEGRFRADLFYRLRVARICLPPLRQRREDIPLLAIAFLQQYNAVLNRRVRRLAQETIRLLMEYPWPGNVRELENAIEFAIIRARHSVLHPDDLPPEVRSSPPPQTGPPAQPEPTAVPDQLDEKDRFQAALAQTKGNRTKAAKLLGISRATFYRRLAQLKLAPPA